MDTTKELKSDALAIISEEEYEKQAIQLCNEPRSVSDSTSVQSVLQVEHRRAQCRGRNLHQGATSVNLLAEVEYQERSSCGIRALYVPCQCGQAPGAALMRSNSQVKPSPSTIYITALQWHSCNAVAVLLQRSNTHRLQVYTPAAAEVPEITESPGIHDFQDLHEKHGALLMTAPALANVGYVLTSASVCPCKGGGREEAGTGPWESGAYPLQPPATGVKVGWYRPVQCTSKEPVLARTQPMLKHHSGKGPSLKPPLMSLPLPSCWRPCRQRFNIIAPFAPVRAADSGGQKGQLPQGSRFKRAQGSRLK
ncbi:hypothetical protein UY3_08472 [Chelonia mydas]|uniref:Uncharacterized protein n=1 Tax=Chelonia mydas TaxID=8469 RepID=M7BB25_CHEMY|nr:hypothetical protein UY3_08472 [Chelonia mydas]